MTTSSTRKALFVTAACLLVAGCGPADPASTAGAAAGSAPTAGAAAGSAPAPAAAGSAPAPAAAGSAPAAGAAAGGDGALACGLISEQDASTAIGHAAGAGTSGGTAALSECLFDESALIVSLRRDSKTFYDQAYADARAKGATDLPGVGDSAFEAGNADHCTLLLLKGTTIVSIQLSAPHAQASAATLAKVAASKL